MNINKQFTISFIDIITAIYCGFCILELNTSNYKFICLALLISWLVVALFADKRALVYALSNDIVLLLCLYALIYFFYVSFTRDFIYGFKYALSIIISESPFFLFLYYEKKKKKSDLSKILPWIGFVIILYLCANILKLIAIDPNAARKMAASTNKYQNYITGGGYQIAYALCILVPFLIYTFREYKHRLITLFFIVTFAYTLVKSSYTIAILLAVFELFLLIFWSKKSTFRSVVIAVMCLICLLFLFLLLRDYIGDLLIEHISPLFSGTFVKRRMAELGQFIKGQAGVSNGATTRMKLYGISIKTFLNSPIIGISHLTRFMSNLEVDLNGVRHLGAHSTILDGFARIGILYGIFVMYYWKALKFIKESVEMNSIMIVGVVFFFMKMLNVADAFGLTYIVYFVIPMLCNEIKSKKENQR